jgi:ABC-type transport system involved in multi-copper enzyme maturation permease subunit
MNTLRVLYQVALADFYERARRYRFLLILAAVILMGVLVNNGTVSLTLSPGDHNPVSASYRGELNPAWIGTMTVIVINIFLGLFGFYLVSDCIQRDIHTGVGQIIATTPVSRAAYLVGKWISNCLVLFVLVLIMAAAAVIMVLFQSETVLDLEALLMPFLAVALPYMALIAALAVVFESVPWLRGALGNVVYFFLWLFGLMAVILVWKKALPFLPDPLGISIFTASLNAGVGAAFPNESIGGMGVGNFTSQVKLFNWPGLAWTPGIVARQALWGIISLGLILLSATWFARFDPSREGLRRRRGKASEADEGEPAAPRKKVPQIALPSLSPLVSRLSGVNPFLGVLFAELRMLLNGRRWWWWLVIAGLNIAILIVPFPIAKQYLLPVAWLWPLAIWSGIGNRERRNNTAQMVFSSARPVLRQLPAAWLAGVLATALLEIAMAVVFLSNGDLPSLAGWVGAVIFIPSLALALGVFSSGSRFFEVVYTIWWYLGPMQKTAGVDFTTGAPQVYLLAAAVLLLLSAYWRGRQVRV